MSVIVISQCAIMKKIILIILCVMLSLSLPALAAPEQPAELSTQPNSVEQVAQRVSDISNDLKLQQQKLEFFKERLELQDKRIGDLSLYLACFGGLMTLMVLFFSLRSTKEAVQAAKEEARKAIQAEANKIVNDELNPLFKKTLNQIHEQGNEELKRLKEERVKASRINDEGSQLNEHYKNRINELEEILGSVVNVGKPLNKEQIQKAEEAEKILESRPPKEHRFDNCYTLGHQALESKNYKVALDHFVQAYNVSSKPIEQASALVDQGYTLGKMRRHQDAIAIYNEVVRRFDDATEASLHEQVAKALAGNGVSFGMIGEHQKAINNCKEVVNRFGGMTEAPLRVLVAGALLIEGFTYEQMEKHQEAIAIYDEVMQRFGGATEELLVELVEIAKQNKSIMLRKNE